MTVRDSMNAHEEYSILNIQYLKHIKCVLGNTFPTC